MTDVALRCRCGKLRGIAHDASAKSGVHLRCYCDSCQAFMKFLEHSEILDPNGGTDIFQMSAKRLEITEGEPELRCMRLSPKGLLRWYAGCCRTPIGNTISGKMPFIGLITAFVDTEKRSVDDQLGKPVGYIHGKFATGDVPAHIDPKGSPLLIARCMRKMIGWWLFDKEGKAQLFDPKTHEPKVEPRVLTKSERSTLRP
jgi:Family of unknown function (DUF6151)